MVRANGKIQAKAVRASLLDLLYTKNRCTAYLPLIYVYIHGVQWPYKAVCMNHHACNIEFVKKKHCRDLRNDGPKHIYIIITSAMQGIFGASLRDVV